MRIGYGWAYELEDGSLCNWAEPSAIGLKGPRPSPEAKKVAVVLVKRQDWMKMKRSGK